MRRNLARPGLSYVDANQGRLVTYTDDVLGIKKRIMDTWPELGVVFDTVDEEWVIFEHCEDGVDRLFFTTPVLSEKTLERITRGDQYRKNPELENALDKANEAYEREQDYEFEQQIGEASERFLHALRKDGFASGPIFMGDEIGNRKSRVQRRQDYY